MAVLGVDISEMNGSVDFGALKRAGVGFVILRCGYGSDFAHQDDSRFQENVAKAEAAGLPWGAYLYSYAQDRAMAESEARHTLRMLGGRKPAYGVWYDVEDKQQAHCGLVEICLTYGEALEGAGCYVGVYSMLSWWQTKLDDPRLDRYGKWVAHWAGACGYGKPYGMWQFTDRLEIGGKGFDGNWAYEDYPALTGAGGKGAEGGYGRFLENMGRYERELARRPVSGWAGEAVAYVKSRGLMQGDGQDFRGHSGVTRQELAQVLWNLRGFWGGEDVNKL